jgi:hypothetical protein
VEEVRRPVDDELCGHVKLSDGSWLALVVFGAVLGCHTTRQDAIDQVLSEGLSSLAERWTLQRAGDAGDVVCIQEANELTVTLALGYYSMPGVPTLTVTRSELDAGAWTLHREQQSAARRALDPAVGDTRHDDGS